MANYASYYECPSYDEYDEYPNYAGLESLADRQSCRDSGKL
jgi:hypothetical protein